MTNIIAKLVLSAVAATAFGGLAGARELGSTPAVMKPSQGLVFEVGSKTAATYYKSANGVCNLTLVMAERAGDSGVVSTPPLRVAVPVAVGKTARVDTTEGKALEFACNAGGTSMTTKAVEQVAWSAKSPKG